MTFDRLLSDLAHRRLSIAVLAAVLAHLALVILGLFIFDWFSVPSNMNRVLLLQLEPAVYDGYDEASSPLADTINNAETGIIQSTPAKQSPAPVLPHESPAAALLSSTDTGQMEQAQSAPLTGEKQQEQSSTNDLVETVAEGSVTEDGILRAEGAGQIATRGTVTLVATEPPTATLPPVSARQHKMLEAKLQEISADSGNIEAITGPVSWEYEGQQYTAELSHVPADNETALDELRIKVVTEHDGQQLSAEMRARKLAFSHFAQFVNRWDPDLQVHDDELTGRFHSNSRFNLEFDRFATPVFHGKVTTASNRVNMNRALSKDSDNAVFRGGIETGVRKIRMPKPKLWFSKTSGVSDENHHTFTEHSRILFNPDGYYLWQNTHGDASWQKRMIGKQPLYLVAQPGKTLHLRGVVNGKVLVYSPKHIVIEGNLTYSDTAINQHSDNFLGLVSDGNIAIARQSTTGSGDLEIHAAIYARGRFLVRNPDGPHSGTLSIFGSLSAGSLSATEPRYATKIVFDDRLENVRPPHFPMTDSYQLVKEDAAWLPLAAPPSGK